VAMLAWCVGQQAGRHPSCIGRILPPIMHRGSPVNIQWSPVRRRYTVAGINMMKGAESPGRLRVSDEEWGATEARADVPSAMSPDYYAPTTLSLQPNMPHREPYGTRCSNPWSRLPSIKPHRFSLNVRR